MIQAVRAWLEQSTADTGWVSAVRDPHVGRAIALIHRKPERRWSVGALASEAHLSRSVFAERFTKLAGMSPMQYVTRWRMRLANLWIREDRETGIPPGAALRVEGPATRAARAPGQGSQR